MPPRWHRVPTTLNSAEAQQEATEKSLLHIIKPEIDFFADRGRAFRRSAPAPWKTSGRGAKKRWLVQDDTENIISCAQTMDGRTQYGLVAACHFDDYLQGKIKKHDRHARQAEDRMVHVRNQKREYRAGSFSPTPAVREWI